MIRRVGPDDLEEVNRLLQRDFPECDFSEVLANPLNVCLLEDESGIIFAWRGPGIYEVHVFYAARGREALRLTDRFLDHMRRKHDARLFWTLIPEDNRKVRMFARLARWSSRGMLETQHGPCELFVSENASCPQSS